MGRGSSKAGGAGGNIDIKGINGYDVKTADGQKMTFFFEKSEGITYYKNGIGEIGEPTPNNMTEKEFISRVEQNGASVDKMTKSEVKRKYDEYKKDREETNRVLDEAYVRDKTMKKGSKTNRIGTRVRRRK